MIIPKIAIIISHAIQHFCPQYISYSQNKNFEIKVFFASKAGVEPYYDPNFKREVKWHNIGLDKFNNVFLNSGRILPINSNLDAEDLEEKLFEYSPDYILQYGYAQKLQRRAYTWAIKNNVPIIYFSDSENRHKRKWYNKVLKRVYLPSYFKKISAFLTTGDANEAYYRYYGVSDKKFFKSPYPIDRELYETAKTERQKLNTEIRKKYGIPESNIVCSVVGKLVSWKSQNHVIRAIKQIDNRHNDLTLMIIGSGEKESEWKREAESVQNNRIIFTGFVSPIDLPAYYSATDIYIHPAFSEPHSVAISEAIYMGCPVILSSNCGSYGSSDDVRQHRNGFVFSFGNIDELSAYIEILSREHDLRIRFSKCSEEIGFCSQRISHFEGLECAVKSLSINMSLTN